MIPASELVNHYYRGLKVKIVISNKPEPAEYTRTRVLVFKKKKKKIEGSTIVSTKQHLGTGVDLQWEGCGRET